jgi:hypothetical protein
MSSKFQLDASPTFTAAVNIPMHGQGSTPIAVKFKHRDREQMKALIEAHKEDVTNVRAVLDVAVGWDLDDEFNEENVAKLDRNYQGAALAITTKYMTEIYQARLGN